MILQGKNVNFFKEKINKKNQILLLIIYHYFIKNLIYND